MEPKAQQTGIYWTFWEVLSTRGLFAVLRTFWVLINNFYCIPSYFFVMTLLLPILFLKPKLFWKIEQVYFDWLLSMVACWTTSAGYDIVESGHDLDSLLGQRFLFMPNHQSTADVPLCMTIFIARRNFCKDVMWIMDKVFKYTNFGSVAWMHDDFFILAGKKNRENSLIDLKKHIQEVFMQKDRKYLVLYPEGGFLRNRKAVSQSFAKKQDLPNLHYVTLPRTGALEVIMDVLGPKNLQNGKNDVLISSKNNNLENHKNGCLQKLVDVTIAYPNGKPLDLFDIISGWRPPCTTHVHYRVFDIQEIPTDVEEMKQFMYQLYIDKEKMLETYYSTGNFPYKMFDNDKIISQKPKLIVHDNFRFLLLHFYFVTTSCICWTMFWKAKSLVY